MTTVLEFKTTEDKQIDDHRKACTLCAKLNYIFYQAHVEAGFSSEQAMEIIITQLQIYDVD